MFARRISVTFVGLMFSLQLLADEALDKFLAEERVPLGSPVKLGEWNGDLDACKKLADETGIPMIAVWSQEGCAHCVILERALTSDLFKEWRKTSGLILCFTCSRDPKGARKSGSNPGGEYYWFCKRPNNLTSYPFVRFYWYKDGGETKVVDYSVHGDTVDKQQGIYKGSYDKAGQNVIDYILEKSGFGAYEPRELSTYAGGLFALEEGDGHRLEAELGTTSVSVELTRSADNAPVTNNLIKVIAPDGTVASTVNVAWSDGQTNQTVAVDISGVFTESSDDQEKALLVATDLEGAAKGTNTITYVSEPVSASNPLWLGERTAETLEWGEWTMDLDVAKAKAAAAEGDAYTLVAVQGSLWCHDCANTERNFLEVMNNAGEVVLNAWAVSNNVALAVVDVPNFNSASVECQSPTYLSRKGYTTTLAYELPEYGFYDYSLGGAEVELLSPMVRSGLGYLTRKGVTDEAALAVLERNRVLVQTNTDEGGFHRPEDTNKNRTGAPIFVLLRKDGSVAARMTRFASKSPYTADAEKIDDIMKRFDEMLELADSDGDHADDIENNYPGDGAIVFAANGGEAAGEISHCDFNDVFKLEGVGGNALQKVTVTGSTDAEVKVSFLKLGADGKREYVGDGVTGVLSDGISLEDIFTEAGDYYVEVTGADITSAQFSHDSAVEGNFHPFTVSGDVVFVPQQERATGTAAETSSSLVVRLVKDQDYRLQGVDTTSLDKTKLKPFSDDAACQFFTALVDGDVDVPLFYINGGSLVYQIWEPGQVGFDSVSATANEGSGAWTVSLSRTDGKSGKVVVSVTLDEEKTDFYNSEGEARFEFTPVDIVWEEGENHKTNVVIGIIEDQRYDGPGNVVLNLSVKEDVNGDTKVVNDTFTLTVKENDVQSAGKAAFVAVEPFFSKKATVYVREGEAAVLYAGRLGASDGAVSVGVRSSLSGVELGGAVTNGVIEWGNHKYDNKEVLVTGVGAGKTATVSLYNAKDGLKILSASNYIRVVGVAAAAPAFEAGTGSAKLYRYVAASNSYPVAVADGAEFTKMTFTKVSGTLPAGLKVSWDKDSNALVLSGVVTAKAGVYTPVYQVVQMNGSKRTPGLTISLEFEVVDFADPVVGEDGETVESVLKKARTFYDIPLVSENDDKLKGVLQLTVPKTGRVSAKYTSVDGVKSFSATGWAECNGTELVAELTCRKTGEVMTVTAGVDGAVSIELVEASSGETLTASHNGIMWGNDNSADAWKGYYTVSLISVNGTESRENLAPSGSGYLTLKMATASAARTGRMYWSGMLPNGAAISGSSVLTPDGDWARLPIFKYSSTDVVAIGTKILANAVEADEARAVLNDDYITSVWTHKERDDAFNASYTVEFGVFGGPYSSTKDLAACCSAYYETTNPDLVFDFSSLGLTMYGEPALGAYMVSTSVGVKTLTFTDKTTVPAGMTMSLNRGTGVVSGSVRIPVGEDGKTVTARWKGVILQGWGPGCGCGDYEDNMVYLPFACGSYYFTDRISTEDGKKTMSVKRGGGVAIGVTVE